MAYMEKAVIADIPELYSLQLLAFESEAEMIGSRDVPALMESAAAHRADFPLWDTRKITDETGRIVAAIRWRKSGEVVDVGRLMVHPDCRRRGLALYMLAEVEKEHAGETLELYTCTKSWANIRLYEKAGYRAVKEVTEASGLSFVYMQKIAES